MSEAVTTVPSEVASAPPGPDKREQVEVLLRDMLRLMDYPAKLEFKDMSDGGLGVAVHFEGELPGITPGKRSYLVDCMQFLVNKVVNRPNTPRRWVSLGTNAFPEPRPERPAPAAAPVAEAAAPVPSAPKAPRAEKAQAPVPSAKPAPAPAKNKDAPRPSAPREADEAALDVPADPVWTKLGQSLADKSARLGRTYAVMLVSPENRARLLAAAAGVKGVTVKAQGEGHWRRVAYVPDKLTPLPKKHVMPDYDDEEE